MTFTKVTTDGIADSAVSTAKIGANAVDTSKIGADVIVADDIAANAITVAEISDGAVTAAKLHNTMDLSSKTVTLPSLTSDIILGGGRTTPSTAGGVHLSNTGINVDIVSNGRTAGLNSSWASLRIHPDAAYEGLRIVGDSSQTANPMTVVNSAGATHFGIDSAGRVQTPDQPGFFAKRTIGGDGRSSGVITEWQIAGAGTFNTGNHFNTSTGTFTAPISGKYLFTAAPGYKQTNINWNFHFEINGTNNSEAVRFIGTPLNSHSTATGTVIYNLSANDTIRIHTSYTHHVNTDKNFFMGYLLG